MSKNLSRRDLLKNLGLGAGVVLVGSDRLIGDTVASDSQLVKDMPPPRAGGLPKQYNERLIYEADACLAFGKELTRRAAKAEAAGVKIDGIQIPLACLPLNVYLRRHPIMADVPAPEIPTLLSSVFLYAAPIEVQFVVDHIFKKLGKVCHGQEEVKEFTAVAPGAKKVYKSRIVTPRYTKDLDDDLDAATLAFTVYNMATGLHEELRRNMDAAMQTYREARANYNASPVPSKVVLQHKPLRVSTKTEAFMWESFAWLTISGYVA